MVGTTGFQHQRLTVNPPEKGSFPLDHQGLCQSMRDGWISCMKESGWDSSKCRTEAAAYLRCRMENNLMDQEEIQRLGFNENEWDEAAAKMRNQK
ncbi:unnamed protein product [Schistocephalus solidus]|uniref:Cytochrome c oxidase assembly protein COX19 n=1 Tax=Schistocephalus solidus TaxID=70667 RepID=A0A183S8S4_SCHSO|nr:unnamed protein product [Schistocephalus solidus]